LTAELLNEHEPEIESITLIPSNEGRFEITVNGNLLFSKLSIHRFPNQGEVLELVRRFLKEGNK
jgi:selenoprotein W-related protein